MRLLLDQNLSWRLARSWADLFPGSVHARELHLQEANDAEVWAVAARRDLVVVTRDADFDDATAFPGPPPKVIHLRVGNASTDAIDALVRRQVRAIRVFGAGPERLLEVR